jgi:uncharacterized Ntn-hydrolase superfamily protein
VTYTIVAWDSESGQMGVATQSHFFALGNLVPWAQSGVGVVATQSFVEVSYGPLGLARLAAGESSETALADLVEADAGRETRQVALVDRHGQIAATTGAQCVPPAGHIVGDHVVALGNMLSSDHVWPDMLAAYQSATGSLTRRLVAALEAGEAAGGDIRGQQSAAIKVVSIEASGQPWRDVVTDLRVDDHPEAVSQLHRLVDLAQAYDDIGRALLLPGLIGDQFGASTEDFARADADLTRANEVLGANVEALVWRAILRVKAGHVDVARRDADEAIQARPQLAAFLTGLAQAGLLTAGQVAQLTGA